MAVYEAVMIMANRNHAAERNLQRYFKVEKYLGKRGQRKDRRDMTYDVTYTLLGVPSCVRFCQQDFGEFPRLMGRYCSYLLPKQAGGTPQILVDKTLRMTSRPAL